MKREINPDCQKKFILQCTKKDKDPRLDGRKSHEYRRIILNYGIDWGSAHVTIGNTRVLAQVTCEIGQPNQMRPNEGMLFINVELSSMASLSFESGRNSNLTVRLNRMLERIIKDSKCVDMESLCVKTFSSNTETDKVWILRVDVNVLNHDGNLFDCCSLAALAALAHFRRPDITVDGDKVKIHTASQKDLLPLILHHYPVSITYATIHNGSMGIVDPTLNEERVAESTMTFGLNSYRELCCLNMDGIVLTNVELLLKCANNAAKRAESLVKYVKTKLAEDLQERESNKSVGFANSLQFNKITSLAEDRFCLKIRNFSLTTNLQSINQELVDSKTMEMKVEVLDENLFTLSSNQDDCKWLPDSDDEKEENSSISDSDTDVDHSKPLIKLENAPATSIDSKMSADEQNNDDELETSNE